MPYQALPRPGTGRPDRAQRRRMTPARALGGHPPRRVLPLVVGVLFVMAALTAGWPLIDRALSDRERLPGGALLELGPSSGTAVLRVVGEGWSLSKSQSDPNSSYALSRDGVDVVAGYVDLTTTEAGAERLWTGLRRVQSVADAGSRLGEPHPVTSAEGARGSTGTLTRSGRTGTATVWLPPGEAYAVEITVLAKPRAGAGVVEEAMALVHSVSFPQEAG
ncbi:hypothetical protein [Streptomyces sp. NPDC091212]|uniref:hypothetical protein n=2 Tax=unclassified Streptomyces TaxID=2593676 RepID=UPI00341E2E44